MTLGEKQELFSSYVGMLLDFIYSKGCAVRMGEAYRTNEQAIIYALNSIEKDRLVLLLEENGFVMLAEAIKDNRGTGIIRTLHASKLAIDLNLFRDGQECPARDYKLFGDFWKSLDPHRNTCWGGDFPRPDVFHFSYMHEGVK